MNKFFSLGGRPPWPVSDVFEVYFSVMQQKSTKRVHQRGRTYGSSPLDTPNSLDGLVVAGAGLIARTVPASRLLVTHALSPLGLAVKAVGSVFSKLSGTFFKVDQCVRADGSL